MTEATIGDLYFLARIWQELAAYWLALDDDLSAAE
jgi:hypothetical protein